MAWSTRFSLEDATRTRGGSWVSANVGEWELRRGNETVLSKCQTCLDRRYLRTERRGEVVMKEVVGLTSLPGLVEKLKRVTLLWIIAPFEAGCFTPLVSSDQLPP